MFFLVHGHQTYVYIYIFSYIYSYIYIKRPGLANQLNADINQSDISSIWSGRRRTDTSIGRTRSWRRMIQLRLFQRWKQWGEVTNALEGGLDIENIMSTDFQKTVTYIWKMSIYIYENTCTHRCTVNIVRTSNCMYGIKIRHDPCTIVTDLPIMTGWVAGWHLWAPTKTSRNNAEIKLAS